MLKLLTCPQGHFWETANGEEAVRQQVCPECGAPADSLPLLDLVQTEAPTPRPAAAAAGLVQPEASPRPPTPLRDDKGRPVVAGYDVLEDLGRGPTGVAVYRAR